MIENTDKINKILYKEGERIMKFNIAICDDEKDYVKEIIDYLDKMSWKRNNKFIYHTFYSGKDLLDSNQTFDVIILDIKMDNVSGVQVKDIFYHRNNNSRIIFLTNYDEYMKYSFGRNVYGYINKAQIEQIEQPMAIIFKELLENRTVVIHGKVINLYKVYYVRADGPYINIHYENDYDIYRMTLSDFEKKIMNSNYIRTHKSYLVNMRYIKEIKNRELILDNDAIINISHNKKNEVIKTYHNYLMENITYD